MIQEGKAFEILDLLPVGILIVGRDKAIRWANREALRLFGAEDVKEVVGRSCQGYLCPFDYCPVLDKGEEVDRSHRVLLRKDGTKVPIIKTVRETELGGERVLLEAFIEVIKEGLGKVYFETVFERTEAMFLLVEEDLTITRVNLATLKHTGYSSEELLGRKVTILVHPDDLPLVLQYHQKRLRREDAPSTYELRFISKGGEIRWGIVTPTVIPQTKQTIISVIDITERRQAEDLFRSVFSNAPIPIYIAQRECFRLVNPEMSRGLGYSEEELLRMNPLDPVHPTDREWVRQRSKLMLKGETSTPYEFRAVRKNGSILWCAGMVTSVNYRGKPAVLGYFMNIDEQKHLQEQLALEKARAEALIENAPVIVVGLGEDSRILLFNDFAEKVTGYRREEVLGKSWIELFIPPEIRGEIYRVWNEVVNQRGFHSYENPILTKDGQRRLIRWNNTTITEGGSFVMVLSIGEDVTEVRRLEEQMRMMLEGIPNPAWLISRERKIIAQNRAARERFKTQEGQYCWEGIWGMECLEEQQRRFYEETGYPLPGTQCRFCEGDRALDRRETINKELRVKGEFWYTWWVPVGEDLYLYYADDVTRYKKMEEELYRLSITDPLTGAYNRRYFVKRLEEEMERIRRGGTTFSIVMIDLDHFKKVNDRYGHQAGDRVLRFLVEVISSRIRKIDLLARWGGEEFVLLLLNTPLQKAAKLAEELRERIEAAEIPGVGRVTASLGVTEYREGDTPDSVISRADDLMYEAKRAGRNCVRYG